MPYTSLHQSGVAPSSSSCPVGAEHCADKAQARAGPAGKNRRTETMVKKDQHREEMGMGMRGNAESKISRREGAPCEIRYS